MWNKGGLVREMALTTAAAGRLVILDRCIALDVQDAAYALLAAVKELIKDMTLITGSAYGLDSFRDACVAISEAERSATVTDPRVQRKSSHDREGSD